MEKKIQHSVVDSNCVSVKDVPAWLKSLRLHKYAALFSTMTYDEMMSLTEEQLEAQVCTHVKTTINTELNLVWKTLITLNKKSSVFFTSSSN